MAQNANISIFVFVRFCKKKTNPWYVFGDFCNFLRFWMFFISSLYIKFCFKRNGYLLKFRRISIKWYKPEKIKRHINSKWNSLARNFLTIWSWPISFFGNFENYKYFQSFWISFFFAKGQLLSFEMVFWGRRFPPKKRTKTSRPVVS